MNLIEIICTTVDKIIKKENDEALTRRFEKAFVGEAKMLIPSEVFEQLKIIPTTDDERIRILIVDREDKKKMHMTITLPFEWLKRQNMQIIASEFADSLAFRASQVYGERK